MVEMTENEVPFLPQDVLEKSAERLREGEDRRQQTRDLLRAGEYDKVDDPARLRARVKRVLEDPIASREILDMQKTRNHETATSEEVLERIMGGENFLGVSFFDLGLRASRCIVRIEIRTPDGRSGTGTGCMVSSRLLLTNNHVLREEAWARKSHVVFDHEDDADGRPRPNICFELDPEALFLTDPGLDFTLVAVADTSQPPGTPLASYGFNPLDPQQGKIAIGECINIIQHPSGMHKQVVIQDNQLLDLATDWLHYESDTMPGSSGAPLFNNRWEMVGLHHSGWPERDADGNILTRDGRVWTKDMGEQAIHWLGNEGARVSRIVARMKELRPELKPAAQALLDDLMSPSKRGSVVAPAAVTPVAPVAPVVSTPPAPLESGMTTPVPPPPIAVRPEQTPGLQVVWNGNGAGGEGEVTITLPLQISLRLGGPKPGRD